MDLATGGVDGGRPDGLDDDGATARLSHLFVTRRPRDVVDGFRSALSNAVRGTLYGLAAAVGAPLALGSKFGLAGLLSGLVAGGVLGVALPAAGFVAGAYQLVRGLLETPGAIAEGVFRCRVYDEIRRAWMEYNLDDDVEEVRTSMEAERERERREEGGRGSGRRAGDDGKDGRTRQRARVKSTEYYDLLDVPSHASQSEIRSAYRRRARDIHPDKNTDDDPDTAVRKFRELSAAYQTLSDPQKRKRYDASGVGMDAEDPSGGALGPTLDPIVFFAVLFGSEAVEPYVGELGMATMFDALLKLGGGGGDGGASSSFESWADLKAAFGWSTTALKRRKRETDIAVFLRTRVADYVEGYLTPDAFGDTCREEALRIARSGGVGGGVGGGGGDSGRPYGTYFLLAIGPALIAEADAFLGFRSSVLGLWRGPAGNVRRTALFASRKMSVVRAAMRTLREGLSALYKSADFVPAAESDDDGESTMPPRGDVGGGGDGDGGRRRQTDERQQQQPKTFVIHDKELLKDNLSNTIPTVLEMAWAINYVDISNALHGACSRLFSDADVPSWDVRLRRAEAIRILGTQFYLVGMEATSAFDGRRGGDDNGTTRSAGGSVDDIKARASAAFMESLKKGRENYNDEM